MTDRLRRRSRTGRSCPCPDGDRSSGSRRELATSSSRSRRRRRSHLDRRPAHRNRSFRNRNGRPGRRHCTRIGYQDRRPRRPRDEERPSDQRQRLRDQARDPEPGPGPSHQCRPVAGPQRTGRPCWRTQRCCTHKKSTSVTKQSDHATLANYSEVSSETSHCFADAAGCDGKVRRQNAASHRPAPGFCRVTR